MSDIALKSVRQFSFFSKSGRELQAPGNRIATSACVTSGTYASVFAVATQNQRALCDLAGIIQGSGLLRCKEELATVVFMEIHVCQRVARCGCHMHRLPFDTIAAPLRVAWELVDDITVIINDDRICKFLPDKTTVCQIDSAAGKRNTRRRVRAFM